MPASKRLHTLLDKLVDTRKELARLKRLDTLKGSALVADAARACRTASDQFEQELNGKG